MNNIRRENERFQEDLRKNLDEMRKNQEEFRKSQKIFQEELRKFQEEFEKNEERFQEKMSRIQEEIGRIQEEAIRINENCNEIINILNKLPVVKIADINKLNEENKRCVICLEDFKNNDKSIYLPCFHLFHEKCITDWINMNKGFCPFCRAIINDMTK